MSHTKKRKRYSATEPDRPAFAQMHPLNPYRDKPPDIAALGAAYPALGMHVSESGHIDFTNSTACIELNQAMLAEHLGVVCRLDAGRLCPAVPNRINYICWIWELLQLQDRGRPSAVDGVSTHATTIDATSRTPTTVLDIGVGSSCIYPLLGTSLHDWNFFGVETDEASYAMALHNVSANPMLSPRIQLRRVSCGPAAAAQGCVDRIFSGEEDVKKVSEQLLEALHGTGEGLPLRGALAAALACSDCPEEVAAVMTNPPFYSETEAIQRNPFTVCTGSSAEMITPGGEFAFVACMILDSLLTRERVGWYSSMLGKKATLGRLLQLLDQLEIANVRTVRFVGGKTVRWALAWSFTSKGQHLLTRDARSADPKVLDVASLSKLLCIQRSMQMTEDDVINGATPLERNEASFAMKSAVSVLSERLKLVFDKGIGSTKWTVTFLESGSQATHTVLAEIVALGVQDEQARILGEADAADLEVSIKLTAVCGGKVDVSYECSCITADQRKTAHLIYEALSVEMKRDNRLWKRKLKKEKEQENLVRFV